MKTLRPIVLTLLGALAGFARADEPVISFSGYGTVGAVYSSEEHADYLVDAFKPNGPGFSRRVSGDVDTRFAAQVTANITTGLSAVVQVVAQQRYDNTYTPAVEWANLKYQFTPDLSVRAGRIVLPVFLATDTRKVGYANPWVRPPVEVYSMVPVTTNDGVDASYRLGIGPATNTLQLTYGLSDSKFPPQQGNSGGTAKARQVFAVVDTLEHGFGSVRFSYGRARLTISAFDPLFDAFRQFGPPGAALADKYGVDDRGVNFVGIGATYDPGPWFLMAEWARFDTHSVVGAKSAWYASGGVRWGKWTPYLTYARTRAESETSDPGLPLVGLPPQVAGVAAVLNATLNAQLAAIPVQDTVSAGVRWDLFRNAAVKLQYDRVTRGSGSQGTFGNVQPGFEPGGKANLLSASVDFVF